MHVWLLDWSENNSWYNCSVYSVDDVPLEQRQHRLVGYTLILLSVVYVPVAFAIYRMMRTSSCYKIMLYIAVCDIGSILVIGVADGVMALRGDVYCSIPKANHFIGLFASGFWYAETSAAVLLAVNRIINVASSTADTLFFTANRTWLMLLGPTLYSAYAVVFTRPVYFNSIFVCWLYNPHAGYLEVPSGSYENHIHDVTNWAVAIGLTGIYVIFTILLIVKQRKIKGNDSQTKEFQKSQRIMFGQVFVVIVINAVTAGVYDIMQFVELNPSITTAATFGWLCCNGVPGVAYFTMNPTIRKECLEMLGLDTTRNRKVHAVRALIASSIAASANQSRYYR